MSSLGAVALVGLTFLSTNLLYASDTRTPPNIILILTDDQRFDAVGYAQNSVVHTPNLDRIASEGVAFTHAFSTLSLCSPSRATCLTGRYARGHTVTGLNQVIPPDVPTISELLGQAGYATRFVGKWHLRNTPPEEGFQRATWIRGNGPHYGRNVFDSHGRKSRTPEYVEDFLVDRSLEFIDELEARGRPFFLWHCTQVPHVDHTETWPVRQASLDLYRSAEIPIQADLEALLVGKPPFLTETLGHKRFLERGFSTEEGQEALQIVRASHRGPRPRPVNATRRWPPRCSHSAQRSERLVLCEQGSRPLTPG